MIAVVSSAEDATPNVNTITDLKKFGAFFLGTESANNASLRSLRYVVRP